MTVRPPKLLKRIGIDIAGYGLVILAALTGWIPGPGGIPLLIAGLSLLSINHEWAKRWLKKAQNGGLNIMGRVFVDHPIVKIVLDIVGVGLIILAVFIVNNYTRNIARSLAISAAFTGVSLFLGNRKRIHWISNWVYQLRGHARFGRKQPKHYQKSEGKEMAVVLIPGIATKWHFMRHLANRLSHAGHQVVVMPDLKRNFFSIPASAQMVDDTIRNHRLKNVVLIGHSKGGLIGKYILYHHNKNLVVKHIIAIATPFHGSYRARLIPHRAFKELVPGSALLQDLLGHQKFNHKITSIYPEFDNYIRHPDGSALAGANNIMVAVKGHDRIAFDKRVERKIFEIIDSLEKS